MKKFAFLGLILISAFKINAQDGYNLYALGNKEMNEGNYRKAEEYYLAAFAKEPQN
jgi:outer membrane protein assembly factor BamD (BamD/ComL family)